jgi:hypothetical protein
MRAYSGNVADWVIEFRREARALINDPEGLVATDEVLAPFLHAALNRVGHLTASLYALSQGSPMAEKLAAWPGHPAPERKKKERVAK